MRRGSSPEPERETRPGPCSRVGIHDPDGGIQRRIDGEEEVLPGNFIAPHGLWVDSRGDLYVGEVTVASGAAARLAPFTPACFQKFVRSGLPAAAAKRRRKRRRGHGTCRLPG